MKEIILDNLYSATQANLSDTNSDNTSYQPQFFSVRGRIGRLRFLSYSWLSMICMTFISGIFFGVLMAMLMRTQTMNSAIMGVLPLVIYLPGLLVSLVFTKRRLNDLNLSGWIGVLALIPFLNLIFGLYLLFAPGTSDNNRYGPVPTKNSVLVVIGSILFPLLIISIIGVLAAIAIPAYKNYTDRAKAAASHRSP
jgi:uncharacterized membrane protein YhaH (DUF805 family)